ncbi:MAG: aldo/keto reductase [Clostridiales bacterium]|jgi:predicted aldo/keto reductase-like oxidoreductase|nr:aldo/keto reductase [Clostridiales bacterium]
MANVKTVGKRYIKKLQMELSPLGFGILRLPMKGGLIDGSACDLVPKAMEAGINYYDTGYCYQNSTSEEFLKETLVRRYPRKSFHIADKMPVWLCGGIDDMEDILNIQLERLGVKYIDMYLLHGLHKSRWEDISRKGAISFLAKKKKEGVIQKIGFSLHDSTETLIEILDAFDWDFAQLQLNYYDWTVQNASASYGCLAERDIPCIVMEPVGGGRLAKLPLSAEKLLKSVRPGDSAASWAIRFAASLPGVAVVLSGMSTIEQLQDNVSTFSPFYPLSKDELALLEKSSEILKSMHAIPCTSCRYCTDGCPKNIDIPYIFQIFNDDCLFEGNSNLSDVYSAFVPENRRGDDCVNCRACIESCPQKIDIPGNLKMVHRKAAAQPLEVDINVLKKRIAKDKDSSLVCFGAGMIGRSVQKLLCGDGVRVHYFCDNSSVLQGGEVNGIPVITPKQLVDMNDRSKVSVLITSNWRDEIKNQLDELGISAIE